MDAKRKVFYVPQCPRIVLKALIVRTEGEAQRWPVSDVREDIGEDESLVGHLMMQETRWRGDSSEFESSNLSPALVELDHF